MLILSIEYADSVLECVSTCVPIINFGQASGIILDYRVKPVGFAMQSFNLAMKLATAPQWGVGR